ncbi:MAG: Fe(3+) ABC transporter substrate-binding protein [Proteobacteria bacterium]|nr:Fe(3+) ABC transporter substrate-binding protein [Pseudomonadota bacterium]
MRRILTVGLIAAAALASATATSAQEVNLYSYRQEFLIKPMLEAFTRETGIKVNIVYAQAGVLERLKAEGPNSPADAVLTVDIGRLHDLAEAGLLRPVRSAVLDRNVPPQFRHPEGLWYGLTLRARVLYYAKDRIDPKELSTYEALADPKWKGRLCMRSSKHPYNVSLMASMIAAHGEAKALEWAKGLAANLARKPQGGDREQAKAIKEGVCDVALGNSYYMGAMVNDPAQRSWAEAIAIFFPNQGDRGTHVNISGVGVTRGAKNLASAVRLIEFLSGEEAQELYAAKNFEYPVLEGVKWDPLVASWGRFKPDTVSLEKIGRLNGEAIRLFDRAALP